MSWPVEVRDPKLAATDQTSAIRLLPLDGMRGLAALGVAFAHYQGFPMYFYSKPLFPRGWLCVDLFFLISGMVMMHVYEEKVALGRISFGEFLTHRVARLWPLHIFAMLVMLALELFGHDFLGLFGLRQPHVMDWNAPIYTFFLNLVFLQHVGLHAAPTWDGNGWSLSPEMILNLVWFYFVFSRRLSSRLIALTVGVCSVAVYMNGSFCVLLFNSHIARSAISFGLGCLVYRHLVHRFREPMDRRWSNALSAIFLSLFVGSLVFCGSSASNPFGNSEWLCVLFIFPAGAYLALQEGSFLNRFFSSKPLVFLGLISYSVYLLHVQVAILLAWAGILVFHHPLNSPWIFVLFLATVIAVATLAYHFVEVPWRKKLRKGLQPFMEKICFDIGSLPTYARGKKPETPAP